VKLKDAPKFDTSMRSILLSMDQGWKGYVETRFEHAAVNDEINIEPHQLDGLSFSMTLVNLIYKLKMFQNKQINIVVMGGSAKGEERLFCTTNYFEELTNFYPQINFKIYFAGPELSDARNGKTVLKNANL
jgi:hypothetical protein